MNYYNKKILPRSKQLFKEQTIPKTGEMEDNEETDHSGFQQIQLLRKEKSNCGGGPWVRKWKLLKLCYLSSAK